MENNITVTNNQDVLSEQVVAYANRFRGFAKSSVKSTLEMCVLLCVVDEADYLTDDAQAALHSLIEQVQNDCRFIFTLNELERMCLALRSRIIPVRFDLTLDKMESASNQYLERVSKLLPALGHRIDDAKLKSIIRAHFPDYRAIANNIEFACH